ncbi:hypothetical protein E2542_SST19401 [Spatholobus suberectus]|nr:hypothetical protein E2542_SST19401 [Spatholobus suberectus]
MAKTQNARNYIKTSFISIINSELKTQHRKRKRRVRPETSSFAAVLVFRATKESTEKVVKKGQTQRGEEREISLVSNAPRFFCSSILPWTPLSLLFQFPLCLNSRFSSLSFFRSSYIITIL